MFEEQKLNHMLEAPKNFKCTDAIFLTYSLNLGILNDMLIQCGITSTYNDNEDSLKLFPDHVTCFMKKDRAIRDEASDFDKLYAQLLLNRDNCRIFGMDKRTFHPKMYAFLYENENDASEKTIRLIITSKNITGSSYYEGAICVEGKPGKDRVSNNDGLVMLLNEIAEKEKNNNSVEYSNGGKYKDGGEHYNVGEYYRSFVELIAKTDFSGCIREMTGDEEAGYRFLVSPKEVSHENRIFLPFDGYKKVRVISPFLGTYDYIQKALENVPNWLIITRKEIEESLLPMDALERKSFIENMKCLKICKESKESKDSKESKEKEDSLVELHAKIYAFSSPKNEKAPGLLYIGSSNFSENGLENNYELMIKIETYKQDFVDLLDDALKKYLDNCIVTQESENADFDSCYFDYCNKSSEEIIGKILQKKEEDELGNLGRYLFDGSFDGKYFVEEFVSRCVNMDRKEIVKILGRAREYKNKKHSPIIDGYLNEIIGG